MYVTKESEIKKIKIKKLQNLQVMTNMRPKSYFLNPTVAIPLAISTVQEVVEQYLFRQATVFFLYIGRNSQLAHLENLEKTFLVEFRKCTVFLRFLFIML